MNATGDCHYSTSHLTTPYVLKWGAAALWLSLATACAATSGKDSAAAGHAGASSGGKAAQSAGAAASSGSSTNSTKGGEQPCSKVGATRDCCGAGVGVQTCTGAVEFSFWSACVDKTGKAVECHEPTACGKGEFAAVCDAGVVDAGHGPCLDEFGECDAGIPLCKDKTINNEPEILAAYEPADGHSVARDGQIKVWVNDEWAAFIAPGEQVDNTTGEILVAGDRTLKSHDGYLFEPALYIGPHTAKSGGTPHFPQWIKGWYNNAPPATKPKGKNAMLGTQGAPVDMAPAGTRLREKYTTEFVWEVSKLGLAPGSYPAEFVIGDGDYDRAVGCVTIVIE